MQTQLQRNKLLPLLKRITNSCFPNLVFVYNSFFVFVEVCICLKEASLILTRRGGNLILSLTDGQPFSYFCGDQVSFVFLSFIFYLLYCIFYLLSMENLSPPSEEIRCLQASELQMSIFIVYHYPVYANI